MCYKPKFSKLDNTISVEALTDYTPDYELIGLLENRIDIELE